MRRLLPVCMTMLLCLIGCGDEGNIQDIPFVEGTVAGESWRLQYGRSTINALDRELEIELFSQDEFAPNACQIVSTNNAHVRLVCPSSSGNYTVPGLNANVFFFGFF